MLKSLLLVATLLCLAHTLSSRPQRNHLSGDINQQCCLSHNGTLCGYFSKDCCASGCDTGFFSQNCHNGVKKEDIVCDNNCEQMCTAKGGALCGVGFASEFSAPKCCKAGDCDASGLTPNCKKPIDITGCVQPTLLNKIFG